MTCFAAVLLVGGLAGRGVASLLATGLVVFVMAYGAGLVIGTLIERTMNESIRAYKAAHPLPEMQDEETPLTEASGGPDNEASEATERWTRKAA